MPLHNCSVVPVAQRSAGAAYAYVTPTAQAAHNATRKQAVVEAANAPTTAEGDAILRARGIPVLPDIYANGGGIIVSFFEVSIFLYDQGAQCPMQKWTEFVKQPDIRCQTACDTLCSPTC